MNAIQTPFLRPERGARFHKCPVRGCAATIKASLAMCHSHWRLVPAELRVRVTAAWRAVCANLSESDSVGRSEFTEHQAALQAAIAAVEGLKSEVQSPESTVRSPQL
jgi:hypothetical protein